MKVQIKQSDTCRLLLELMVKVLLPTGQNDFLILELTSASLSSMKIAESGSDFDIFSYPSFNPLNISNVKLVTMRQNDRFVFSLYFITILSGQHIDLSLVQSQLTNIGFQIKYICALHTGVKKLRNS